MDQYTRRIVGFAVHRKTLDRPTICGMLSRIISGTPPPTCLSSDNDPLFEFHRWKANLRIPEIDEIRLSCFQDYYNRERAHQRIGGVLPEPELDDATRNVPSLHCYRWKRCCHGLYQLPVAA